MAQISDSLIEKLFRKWKRILKIKKKIVWTDNAEVFKKLALNKKSIKFIRSIHGASILSKHPVIFINKSENKTEAELEHTILHELSHVKYPKFSETRLRQYINRKFFQ